MTDEQYKPSSDIPLPTDHAELEAFAKAWIDTAAFHLRNEEYWRERAEKAEAKLKTAITLWNRWVDDDESYLGAAALVRLHEAKLQTDEDESRFPVTDDLVGKDIFVDQNE